MSWFISAVLAGMLFSSESTIPVNLQSNYIEPNKTQIVRLDETERFEQTYPLNANGKVSVSNINGSITVEAWDRNEVKLVAVKTAENREILADIQIQIESRPEFFRVETDLDGLRQRDNRQNRNYGKLEVEYKLTVPRGAVLDQIEAVNGSVVVSNLTNFTKISAVNGSVKATNLSGAANLSTVNGTVEADYNSLQPGSRISLSTVNGSAFLIIPSDANATIKADSLNGNIVNDFGLPVRKGEYVGRNLYGRIGSGDIRINLNSVNGELAVKRKQDGKTVNPVTNLTTQASTNNPNDEDFDADSESKSKNKAKIARVKPVTAPRAVYVPMPEIDIDVQREMEKAQVELAKARIKINTAEINAQVKEAMEKQKEAFARMRETNWIVGSPAIEKKSESFPVKGVPQVSVQAGKCDVYIRGWDKSEVQYSLTKFSRSTNPSPIDVKTEHTDSNVNIEVQESDGNARETGFMNGAARMRLEVFVPKKSNLRIHTDGEIRLENVSGEFDLQANNDAVNVRDSDGKLSVKTDDGRIRVIGFRGILDAFTVEGVMNLEGDFQGLEAKSMEGTIILSLPANTNASFQTNAEIQGDGLNLIPANGKTNFWQLGSGGTIYRLTTEEGKIIVRNKNEMNVSMQ